MKEILVDLGGRGGGGKDMAQGGPTKIDGIADALARLASHLKSQIKQ
jgi:alanyl-tRNA synthetase